MQSIMTWIHRGGDSQIQNAFEPYFKMYLCIFSNYRRDFMCYAKYNDVDTWRRGSPKYKLHLSHISKCISVFFSNYRRDFMCYAKYNDVDT